MTTPVWILLGFAGWTLLILLVSVGGYRWGLILAGRAAINDFPGDRPHGAAWYQRATRAHVNCLENLPVYTAIVVAATASGVDSAELDMLAIILLAARVVQTTTHILFVQTPLVVSIRFTFFFIQFAAMVAMGVIIVTGA